MTKFVSITNRYPMERKVSSFSSLFLSSSDSILYIVSSINHFFPFSLDKNCYYNRIHLIFLEQNPSISSFDVYRPSWEYLKDSQKFQSIIVALKTAPYVALKNGNKNSDSALKNGN